MIVVSDTSPITALMTIGRIELLPKLFTEVFVPEAVHADLLRSHSTLPDWLQTGPFLARRRRQILPGRWMQVKPRPSRWRKKCMPTGC